MGKVIHFEERAVAHLRERLGAAEEANQDLIAFARGHSGAVSSIHSAVIAAMEADGVDALLHVITQEWPLILGIDAVDAKDQRPFLREDRKSTRLNSSHPSISYAVFCLKKKKQTNTRETV